MNYLDAPQRLVCDVLHRRHSVVGSSGGDSAERYAGLLHRGGTIRIGGVVARS